MLCVEVIKYKNKSLKNFIISFGVLFLCSIVEIISYNLNLQINTGSFLQLGVLIFLIVLSLDSLKKAREIVQLSENAKQYEYLATRDYMTKCKNRNAYITELEHLSPNEKTAIILADINNTKYINDTYGHHAGDFVIVKCSQSLISVFGDDEFCYRIGGDEFVCIVYNESDKAVNEKIDAFFQNCAEINSDCPYPFEVSIGYAFYDKQLDKNIYDTVKRADKDMYRSKSGMKFSSI
jgi:diguanylate cyclase (GGDEF)-like protein